MKTAIVFVALFVASASAQGLDIFSGFDAVKTTFLKCFAVNPADAAKIATGNAECPFSCLLNEVGFVKDAKPDFGKMKDMVLSNPLTMFIPESVMTPITTVVNAAAKHLESATICDLPVKFFAFMMEMGGAIMNAMLAVAGGA